MPLSKIQQRVIAVIRQFRNQKNFVGGGAALNLEFPRLSDDLDIYAEGGDDLTELVTPELEALRSAEYSVSVTVSSIDVVEAIVERFGFQTKLQWMSDPEVCLRFFPAVADKLLGYRLHQADVAVNKVLCASRRRTAARDVIDLATIAGEYAPLGPLIWACSGKDTDVSPIQTIRNIRNIINGYSSDELRVVRMANEQKIEREQIIGLIESALSRASKYCDEHAPENRLGELFMSRDGVPVEANSQMLDDGLATGRRIKRYPIVAIVSE